MSLALLHGRQPEPEPPVGSLWPSDPRLTGGMLARLEQLCYNDVTIGGRRVIDTGRLPPRARSIIESGKKTGAQNNHRNRERRPAEL